MNLRTPSKPQGNLYLEDLSGSVERVTFHNPESGFSVLRVNVKGRRDLVTVVGTIPHVNPGEWIDARGTWTIDPKYGQQLKAENLHSSPPNTIQGMEKYLASGLVKGIGTEMAGRLIEAFGKDTFRVIEKTPERLTEVDGIGPMRREKIVAAWTEEKHVQEIMVFLYSHDVSTSRAFRIYKTYGINSIDVVSKNPYRLAQDIRGIGFLTADKIAESLGIPRDSPLRARAGVEYVLRKMTEDGHTAYPRDGLKKETVKLLKIPEDIVHQAIDDAVTDGRLNQYMSQETDYKSSLVVLSALDHAEWQLARDLVDLSIGPHPLPPIDIIKAISWAEERVGLKLADAQKDALGLATRAKVMVITGGPGVGKTTLVNSILKVFVAKKLRVVLCAPTGRAARRLTESTGMEAKTIHRLLEFDHGKGDFRYDDGNPLSGDLFVVDETSMIDLMLASQLVRAIPKDAALVFVGDIDQLPSVGPGSVLRDMIDSGVIEVARLTEVFRQAAESAIITNAHRVNSGMIPELSEGITDTSITDTRMGNEEKMRDFYFIACDDPEKGVDLIIRLIRDRIPARTGFDPIEDIQVLTPMQRGELGVRNLNKRLQEALNPGGESVSRFGWTYRVGDKVMQIVNNYEKDVFNGEIGTTMAIDEGKQELRVSFPPGAEKLQDREVVYGFGELDELVLSFAISIHKSQGSEYPAVVVPVHTQHYIMLRRNLLYTAITRGKKLLILVGNARALSIAVKKPDSHQRITTLKGRLSLLRGERG